MSIEKQIRRVYRCTNCGREFRLARHTTRCPSCGGTLIVVRVVETSVQKK